MNKITPKEAKTLIDSNKSIQIIDVRTPSEYEEGHIANSINIPLQKLQSAVNDGIISDEEPVVVYCHSGARASQAVMFLNMSGFSKVYNLGGILNWPFHIEK